MMKNDKDKQNYLKTDTHASYYFGRVTSNRKNENYIVMNLTKKNLETHVNDKDRYIKRQ